MQKTGRLSHSSLVSRLLLAGSSSVLVLKSVRPSLGSLPSLASRPPALFLEASYSPGSLREVAGLRINPVPISILQSHLRPFYRRALKWLQQLARELRGSPRSFE